MRVIGGKFRSRALVAPHGLGTRPSSDRLRETLFNVIAPKLEDCVFLDLYAGSGAVGLEALSRGARMVHFVERSREAIAALKRNVVALGVGDSVKIHVRDVSRALPALQNEALQFDICFLDPPYRMQEAYQECLKFLSESALLGQRAIAIAEHDKHFDLPMEYGRLERIRDLKQGDTVLSFYAARS